MLASHDTFTYLEPSFSFFNLFKKFWRCQNTNILEQYSFGIRYFDIRVYRREDEACNDEWVLAHGLVGLNKTYASLRDLCDYMETVLKGSMYRIVLEKGNSYDVELFKEEVSSLVGVYNGLVWIVIKRPWETVYIKKNHPKVEDMTFKGWFNIKNLFSILFDSPIKKYAYKTNRRVTPMMKDDKDIVYFLDYATEIDN